MSKRWMLFERLIEQNGALSVPRALLSELAVRIDEAVSTRDYPEMASLGNQMRTILDTAVRDAPDAAASASRDLPTTADAAAAYRLGQYGFAHLILANAVGRRVRADFAAILQNKTYAPYVAALSTGDKSGVELSELVGRQPETVSRNLRLLREIGAVDFRSNGTQHLNFLTPAARIVAGTNSLKPLRERTPISPCAQEWVTSSKEHLAPFMRQAPTFATTLELVDG